MKRRSFIMLLGGAAAWPLAARAQQRERMRRIGIIVPASSDDAEYQVRVGALLQELQQLGWNLQRRQTHRPSRAAADQVRAGDQPQDREGARPHRAADTARPRRRGNRVKRRAFITLIGGVAAAWPLVVRAQQSAMPVVAFVTPSERDSFPPHYVAAFRKGLSDTGYIEGQNVSVEYHWLEGRYDRLPALMANLVRRQVAVIATPGGSLAALAAKAATATIPIVFGVAENPVSIGLVASLARPGGNLTGINFFLGEVVAKRLGLLHELVPKAVRIAVLVNPANIASTESIRDIPEAARTLGLQVQVLKASTGPEIDAGFSAMVRDRADALFIAPDAFFVSRRVQFATLAARDRVPTSCVNREMVEAGLLMSYGANIADMFLQVGIYTGDILKGTKPADLPVLQSTKFEFVINLQTAKALGIEVPLPVQQLADEVIE